MFDYEISCHYLTCRKWKGTGHPRKPSGCSCGVKKFIPHLFANGIKQINPKQTAAVDPNPLRLEFMGHGGR